MNTLIKQNNQLQPTNSRIIAGFFNSLDVAPSTKKTYKKALKQYLTYAVTEEVDIFNASKEQLLRYKASLLNTVKASTANTYLTVMRNFYSYLEEEDLIARNKAKYIKAYKTGDTSPKEILTTEQTRDFLSTYNRNKLEQYRDYAIAKLLSYTGLRTIEVRRANIEDIRTINGKAVMFLQRKGKTDKSEFINLVADVLNPILEYLALRNETDLTSPLFCGHGNRNKGGRLCTDTISRTVKKHFRAINVNNPHITAHSLRHGVATQAYLAGVSTEEIKELLGHSHSKTTDRYIKPLKRTEAKAELAIAKAFN
ncbi:MAG: tyrosine-type recombinase/integrase [Streptococcus gallolyticus]|nr:tyrosine-type recombinase/integrase [Streptococcus gallolyticus]